MEKSDEMARVENKNELTRRQLVADLDAPDEAQAGEEELAAEALSQLKIRLVVAHRLAPRVVQLANDRIQNDHNGLENQLLL